MAGKITIRRIGPILPMLCLLLLVALCVLIGRLTMWGAPDSTLRYVENLAAEHGLTLRLDALKLDPSRGLAVRAEGVKLYTDPAAAEPMLTADRITMGFNISHLLVGELRPGFVHAARGTLQLPVTDPPGKQLELKLIDLSARMGEGNKLHLTSGKMELQGMAISLQGTYDFDPQPGIGETPAATPPPAEQQAEPEPSEAIGSRLTHLLAKHQKEINQIYRQIEDQNWSEGEHPTLDVRVHVGAATTAHLRGNVPKFDIGQFHFRKAQLELQYNNRTISIRNLAFETVDPDTTATLHGSYNLQERRLSFTLNSSAALMRMVRSMSSGKLKKYLYKFRHPDDSPPHIVLSGAVRFESDYSLASVLLRGSLSQKDMLVGSTKADSIDLSFFYNNGDFNIDQLDLIFPDGSLRGTASAQGGEGQAQLAVDLPVQKILTLIHELGAESVELPEGLTPGERVNLAMHAQLTTPAFKPGQTDWQEFVPSFHKLNFALKTDRLAYKNYELANPQLNLQLSDLQQNERMIPQFLGKLALTLAADSAVLPRSEGEPATLQLPELKIEAENLQLGENSLPRKLAQVDVSLRLDSASRPGDKASTLGKAALAATLRDVSLDEHASPESLHIGLAEARLEAKDATLSELTFSDMQVDLTQMKDLTPLDPERKFFSAASLRATAQELAHGDTTIGSAELTCHLQEHAKGSIELTTTRRENAPTCTIKAAPDWTDPNAIVLRDILLDVPGSTLSLVLELLGQESREVRIPDQLSIEGSCTLSRVGFRPIGGQLHLAIPKLERTPHKQPPFRGLVIPLGLDAQISLSEGEQNATNYKVNLLVTHDTGQFEGVVTGSTAGTVRVTGTNTIRPDVVDKLIDSEDAHYVISDFRFPAGGGATISHIDTRIDYTHGLKVESDCDVDLRNTEYLIAALNVAADGTETLRKDLGDNPYTYVNNASCHVHVFVLDNCTDEQGNRIRNESVVTISNAVLNYDNTPWMRRKKIKNGVRHTRLEGDAIVIDIERSYVELRQVRGTVYPAYSLGMFYPDLQHYMEDVLLTQPVQISTAKCVFPIYSDCKLPMSGTIRAIAPSGASYRFLGTTIPLDDFSGFIYLTDNYVQLDRMNAKCWEGVLDATVKIGIVGHHTSFDGYVTAQCMNLKNIAAAYDSKQEPALCSGNIRFRSPSPNLKDIRAYGEVNIENGDLMTLKLFRPVSELITNLPEHFLRLEKQASSVEGKKKTEPGLFSRIFTSIFHGLGNAADQTGDRITRSVSYIPGLNHLIAYDLQKAHTKFDIINGHFVTRGMQAKGYNLNVQLNLDINIETLDIDGNVWPRISSLPTILLAPLTFLSDFIVDIVIYGRVDDIKWRIGLAQKPQDEPPSATSDEDKEPPVKKAEN